jgi:hypothetical protein
MFVQLCFWPSGHSLFNISYRSRGWVSFAVYIYFFKKTTCKHRILWHIYILSCIKSSVVQYAKTLYPQWIFLFGCTTCAACILYRIELVAQLKTCRGYLNSFIIAELWVILHFLLQKVYCFLLLKPSTSCLNKMLADC